MGLDRLWRPLVAGPLLLVSAAALSLLFADRGLPLPDEGAVLTNAAKILRGGVYYRDIDAYPFPAATYALALAMGVLGEHVSVARGLAALLFCGMVAALYAAALRFVSPRSAALFGVSLLSLKLVSWPAFSVYLYSEFAFVFSSAGIALLVWHRFQGPTPALVLAGACVALALASKQNLGIYLGVVAGLALTFPGPLLGVAEVRRARVPEVLAFGAGAALVLVPFLGFFAWHGVLRSMLESGLLRPFTGYLPTSTLPFGPALEWWQLGALAGSPLRNTYLPLWGWNSLRLGVPGPEWTPAAWGLGLEVFSRALYTSIPVALLSALALRLSALRRRTTSHGDAALSLLALLALACVASAFPRADFYHVSSVYPVVGLLCFALLGRAEACEGIGRARPWVAALQAVGVVALLLGSAAVAIVHTRAQTYRLELERASLRVTPEEAWVESLVRSVRAEVPPGERIFVYGHEAHWYFLTERFYPWPFAQLYPGQAGGDGGAALARLIQRQPPALVLRGVTNWPGVPKLNQSVPELMRAVYAGFGWDPRFFDVHPPPAGAAPEPWVLAVMRPRAGPSTSVPPGEPYSR